MKIHVTKMATRDERQMMLVTVFATQKRDNVNDNAEFSLFVPAHASVAEVRLAAIQQMRLFAQELLDERAAESEGSIFSL